MHRTSYAILFFLVSIVLLAGCSSKEYIYQNNRFYGEGQYWQAEYIIESKKDPEDGSFKESKFEFIVIYKGDVSELKSVEQLQMTIINDIDEEISKIINFTDPPDKKVFRMSGGSSGSYISEDDIFEVNVVWGDFEEKFEIFHN
ncbi:hypothetical protein [Desulfitibacter alkalitolerans]|uniref:hypothetical protein n=1 Tax=Desulfitibacter alkalitolerans TaxID=264641 RepID=UPI00047F5334|nr:hypothetical protein [Desulfitibacter alkalitolerans]